MSICGASKLTHHPGSLASPSPSVSNCMSSSSASTGQFVEHPTELHFCKVVIPINSYLLRLFKCIYRSVSRAYNWTWIPWNVVRLYNWTWIPWNEVRLIILHSSTLFKCIYRSICRASNCTCDSLFHNMIYPLVFMNVMQCVHGNCINVYTVFVTAHLSIQGFQLCSYILRFHLYTYMYEVSIYVHACMKYPFVYIHIWSFHLCT